MKKINSLRQLAEFFWELEEEFNLIDFKIGNVKVWQYQRFRIFNELTIATGLYKRAHTKKNGFSNLLKVSGSLLYYSLFSNPLSGNYTKDILIFNTGRKVNVEGKLIDAYTKYFIEEEGLTDYEIIEELYENKHLIKKEKNTKHQDYQQIRTFLLGCFSSFKLTKQQKVFIYKISNQIYSDLGVEIQLESLFKNGYLNFKNDFTFYVKLLKKRKPSKVFLVCSYAYKKALVAAAKHCNIESIELQHGTIDKFHMGYSYPNSEQIDYFPNKMYVFGQYWKDVLSYPLAREKIVIKGFPYFNKQRDLVKDVTKIKNKITILSQGTIGLKLSQLFVANINLFKSFNIIYKLHPGEYSRWREDYSELRKVESKICIVDHNNENLYNYLKSSEYVIGVYSTAIYEALSLDCKVFLIDLPGIEYMSELIRKDYAIFVKDFFEINLHIQKGTFSKFPTNLFFKS